MANELLRKAATSSPRTTKRGMMERLFTVFFQGFVYNQIWEDPDVDIKAMGVGPDTRIITIASGGCNILNYLAANPKSITAVDLNPNHLALTRLKIAAVKHAPSYEAFFQMFAVGKGRANVDMYRSHLEQHVDAETRAYWNGRMGAARLGRRISMFSRGFYRYSLLGKFIGWMRRLSRTYGLDTTKMLRTHSIDEQRSLFAREWEPVFKTRFVRWVADRPMVYYMLGIPPQQFDELAGSATDGQTAQMLRGRIYKLACEFPINRNYFAWQAFSRHYDTEKREAVPSYLKATVFETLRDRTDRIEVKHVIMTDFLAQKPENSFDRFVLLDAQDWMNEQQISALWKEITRVSSSRGRVIFRTAGEVSPLERKLPPDILSQWQYLPEESAEGHRNDRSSIYGGFHIYEKRA
jgi:S-adenosylmethionine-diacylglycerol 3-amino-3-carboxypropyl transferase